MEDKIPKELEIKLDRLAEEGNKYFDDDEYDKALEIWKKALALIPEPKQSFSETVWFLTSIGDVYFAQRKCEESFKIFEDAKNNLSGEGYNNPFVMLRLGQSAYEIGDKNTAIEYLLRAYMLEGTEIFEEDDDKYFEFLKSNVIKMDELFTEFKFNENTDYDIKEINGMQLPNDYLEFMHRHNGGEGNVGKNSYMQFIKLEELIDYNNGYEIFKYYPNCFCFGGDLGGNHFCYNFTTKEYFAIDCCTSAIEDSYCKASSLYEFIITWDNEWCADAE